MDTEDKVGCGDMVQTPNDLAVERPSGMGVITDELSNRYVRWCQDANDNFPRVSIQDCYKLLGVRRAEVPNVSRLRSSIGRGHTSTRCIPLDDDLDGKIVVRMTIPVPLVPHLLRPLSDEVRLRVQGKLDKLIALVANGHHAISPVDPKRDCVDL